MGNCIVSQNMDIKKIKTDRKICECKPLMKVRSVICDTQRDLQHLHPDADMIADPLYYLLPLLGGPSLQVKKRVKISSAVTAMGQESGALRIKLVIRKQELQAMLQKGGVTADNVVIKQQHKRKVNDTDRKSSAGWMPVLESIPEGN